METRTIQNSFSHPFGCRLTYSIKTTLRHLVPGHFPPRPITGKVLSFTTRFSALALCLPDFYPVAKLKSGRCVSEIADRLLSSLQVHLKLRPRVETSSICAPLFEVFGLAGIHQGWGEASTLSLPNSIFL
jgi:hypothetical protein